MEIESLIDIASRAYDPDDPKLVRMYFDDPEGHHGDTLAKFIAIELQETFEPDADDETQLHVAAQCMERAAVQLEQVAAGLTRQVLDREGGG